MTPELHDWVCLDSPVYKPLSDFCESGAGIGEGSVFALGILSSAPEDLRSGAGSGPDGAVETLSVSLFRPKVDLATEDELSLFSGEAGTRIINVD